MNSWTRNTHAYRNHVHDRESPKENLGPDQPPASFLPLQNCHNGRCRCLYMRPVPSSSAAENSSAGFGLCAPHCAFVESQLWLRPQQSLTRKRRRAGEEESQYSCTQTIIIRTESRFHRGRCVRRRASPPKTEQPLSLLYELALASYPETRCIHQAECFLPTPESPANPCSGLTTRSRIAENRGQSAPGPFTL